MARDQDLRYRKAVISGFVGVVLFLLVLTIVNPWLDDAVGDSSIIAAITPPLKFEKAAKLFGTDEYRNKSAKLLSGAVQIPTISYDDMDIDPLKDSRFQVFHDLHEYLFKTFPRTSKYVETVNTYGLLYTIQGSDPTLKPVAFMAHQDVLPVNPSTLDQWEYPPFDGTYDGDWLHGRGSADTKNLLVGTLEAIESLLNQDWSAERTVIVAFGFDEEITGPRGAGHLASLLLKRYGHDGVEVILDEGGFLDERYGTLFALPAVAEKGRVDLKVTVDTPGGHSSMPPDHTGIGIASALIESYEADKFTPEISPDGVLAKYFAQVGKFGASVEPSWRKVFSNLHKAANRRKLVQKLVKEPLMRILVQTTMAADTIEGGVKVNALPERVSFVVNHRIIPGQSVASVKEHLLEHAQKISEQYKLKLREGSPHQDEEVGSGIIWVELGDGPQEPSPISPYSTEDDAWNTIIGTTKHVFESIDAGEVHGAPYLMGANTDTSYYWNVSSHIYRYQAIRLEDRIGHHTVNEKIRMRSHITCIMFIYEFLLNFATNDV